MTLASGHLPALEAPGRRIGLAPLLVAAALLAPTTTACASTALSCLLCTSLVQEGGSSEEDPRSVREWPTPLGRVRETFWTPFSMPDASFDCRYVLVDDSGETVPLAHVSVENHTCEARRAPVVDDAGLLIVPSGGAFVVWSRTWARAREVSLRSMTFRRTILTTLDPTLRIDGETWTIAVAATDAFISVDGGATWRSVHEDARLD